MKLQLYCLLIAGTLHSCFAGECMTGSAIERSFVVENRCYWLIDSSNYTGWDKANKLCELQAGSMAIITSDSGNSLVARHLTRPAFIGYHKLMNGDWKWVNTSISYTKSFASGNGVHTALTDDSGDWEPTYIDAKGHIYDLLCSLDQDPYLRCSDVSVSYSTSTKNMPLYSGDAVTFTCFAGFHVTVGITVQSLTCLPPNKWSFPARHCKPIECDLIDPPAYTVRNSEDHTVGDSAVYSCTNDTWFFPGVDRMIFECQGTGEWVPSLRPCQFIRCQPPPFLPMGTLDTTVTLFRHQITYTCITGYVFADGAASKTISCEGNPQNWTTLATIESLNCTQIFCPGIPAAGIDTRSHQPQSLAVGHFQVWWCWEGYTHPTGEMGTSAECLKSNDPSQPNDWSRSIPACGQIGCPSMSVRNATRISVLTGNDSFIDQPIYPLGYPVKYACPNVEGWVFPGGAKEKIVTCMTDGQWDIPLPLSGCTDSSCEKGWVEFDGSCYYISNGRSLGLRYEYAEASCGYKRSSLVMITSDREAEWIGTVTYEVYQRDFWIGFHRDGSGSWVWKGVFNTNYTNFAEGYPEYFPCARTSVRGKWKDRNCDELLPYICKKTSICGPSPTITNGGGVDLPEFPVNIGHEILYVCEDGHRFKDGSLNKTIKCMEGGFWSELTNCVEDLCPLINTAAMEVHEAWFDTTLNKLGSVVTYTCQDGHLFPGGTRQKKMECLPGGKWSQDIDECKEFKCPKPASPATTPRYGYDDWGVMDYYKCDRGYSFADAEIEKLFWCTRDGTWLPQGQTCIRRACPKYSVPFATVTPDEGVFEDTIVVQCLYGYEFPDTSSKQLLTCTADGTWSKSVLACIATECEGPKPPEVEGAYRDTDEITSGTIINYTCLDDLVYINGDKFRIAACNVDNLQWLNVPSRCVDGATVIKTEHSHPPSEAPGALTYGAIGMGALITILLVIFGLDAITISRFIPCGKSSASHNANQLYSIEGNAPPQRTPQTRDGNFTEPKDQREQENEDEESSSEYETDDEEDDIELATYRL